MGSFVRIAALMWADILVAYALFVMQNYLTEVWGLGFTHAAAIINFYNGISMGLPVLLLFLRDAWLGNRGVLLISSVAYSVGIGLLTMSVPSVLGKPCKENESKCIGHEQKALYYAGMVLIAVGVAGNLTSVKPFLDDQNETNDQQKQIPSGQDDKSGGQDGNPGKTNDMPNIGLHQIPGIMLVVVVPIVGAIALPYVQPWVLRFGIPAILTLVATILFWSGLCECNSYFTKFKKSEAKGSPISNICKVFVACVYKCSLGRPDDNKQFYKGDGKVRIRNHTFKHTRCLRCLEKAAIIHGSDGINKGGSWTLCSIDQVEEAKIAVRMVPVWLTFIACGIVSSIGNTYFVEQANHLDRHIGKWNVPLTALLLFREKIKEYLGSQASKFLQKHRTHGPAVGIVFAMVFSVLCCITAAKIEQRRLNAIRKHNLQDKPDDDVPMSIYWLLFQFFLLAGLDALFEKSVVQFYVGQAPPTMKDYLVHLTKAVFGLGFMCNVLTVYVVRKVKPNWLQETLNRSRLDQYYWVLSAMSAVNLVVFIVVASCYNYKEPEPEDGKDVGIEGIENGDPSEKQYCNWCCCC